MGALFLYLNQVFDRGFNHRDYGLRGGGQPAKNDPIDPNAIAGGFERDARRASPVIRCFAVALALVFTSASAEDLIGKIIHVTDGDTLTVRTAQPLDYRIRINGIDAPEKGQGYGDRAKRNLEILALNKEARLDCYKTDKYRRKVCRVFVDGKDIGLEQVRVGAGWWYREYANEQTLAERGAYGNAETEARAGHLGLWYDKGPMPPWEWRVSHRGRGGQSKNTLRTN